MSSVHFELCTPILIPLIWNNLQTSQDYECEEEILDGKSDILSDFFSKVSTLHDG